MKSIAKTIGRYFLYLLAAAGFLFSGGILVLYSLGYRYDFATLKPYKIGILSISTKPEGATVYLDGKLQKKKTPVDFRNLLPKNYTLKIEKDGFQSYETKIAIEAGLVTRIENLFLIAKKLEPVKIPQETFANPLLSPDGRRIAYTIGTGDNAGIWQFDITTRTLAKLFPLQKSLTAKELQEPTPLSWSQSGRSLLVKVKSENEPLYLINVDSPIDTRKFSVTNFKKIVWKDEEPFFLTKENNLISQFGEVSESLSNVLDATFFGGQLYLIRETNSNIVLERRPDLKERSEEILKLPSNTALYFYPETNYMIMFRSRDDQLFWLKTENSPQLVPITAKAKNVIFNGKTLIVWDGLELNVYNFPFEEKKLLAKLPETIIEHLSFFEKNAILIKENGQITIRSLYGGSGFPLILAPNANVFGIRDKTLFYETNGSLYSLTLQPK